MAWCHHLARLVLISCAMAQLFSRGEALTIKATGGTLMHDYYRGLINMYSVVQESNMSDLVRISYKALGSGVAQDDIRSDLVDFAGSDSLLTADDYLAYPDIQMYPVAAAAIVPVYNIPTLLETDTLVLTRSLLPKIFLGDIRMWNDPEILQANPQLANRLPAQSIKLIVRAEASGVSEIFTSGLSSFDSTRGSSSFEARIGKSSMPDWCEQSINQANTKQTDLGRGFGKSFIITCRKVLHQMQPTVYHAAEKEEGVAALVALTNYSLGYMGYYDSMHEELSIADVINHAGERVTSSATSVGFALLQATEDFDERFNIGLQDAFSRLAWPLTGTTYIILRQRSERFNCAARKALIGFLRWVYNSPDADDLALSQGLVTMPLQIRRMIMRKMSMEMTCCESTIAAAPVFSNRSRTCSIVPYEDEKSLTLPIARGDDVTDQLLDSLSFMLDASTSLPALKILPIDQTGSGTLSSSTLEPVVSRLMDYQVQLEQQDAEMGIFIHELIEIAQGGVADSNLTESSFVTIPLFVTAIVPLYHISAIDTNSTTLTPIPRKLVMTVEVLVGIYLGSIATWDHEMIRAINPQLFQIDDIANSLRDVPIKVLLLEDTSILNYVYSAFLSSRSSIFRETVGLQMSWKSLAARIGQRAIVVESVAQMASQLAANDFILGYDAALTAESDYPFGVSLLLDQDSGSDGAVSATAQNLENCFTTGTDGEPAGMFSVGDQSYLMMIKSTETASKDKFQSPSVQSTNDSFIKNRDLSLCWPLAFSAALTIRANWEQPSCSRGKDVAQFSNWLFAQNALSVAAQDLGGVTPYYNYSSLQRQAILDVLSSISCEGDSFLNPLPVCTFDLMQFQVSDCDPLTLQRWVSYDFKTANSCRDGAVPPTGYARNCDSLAFSSKLGLITLGLVIVGALLMGILIWWTYKNRRAKIIVNAQKELLWLFGLGCIILQLAIASFLGSNNDFTCLLRPWASSVLSTLAFVPLCAKLYRLHKVFTAKLKRVSISTSDLILRILLLVMVDVLLVGLWTVIDRPRSYATPIVANDLPDNTSPLYYDTKCTTMNSPFFWVLVAWKCIVLGCGVIVTARTWNLDEKFSDARWLGVIIYNVFLITGISTILVFLLLKDDGATQTFVICFTVFLIAVMSISLQTLPKMYKFYHCADAREPIRGATSGEAAKANPSSTKRSRASSLAAISPAATRNEVMEGPSLSSSMLNMTGVSTKIAPQQLPDKMASGRSPSTDNNLYANEELTRRKCVQELQS